MGSVVKHSYVTGPKMKAKISAHINYIQFRKDVDREEREAPRSFHTKDRDDYLGRDLKREINRALTGRDVVHKLIVSPGNNNVDLKEYTREVLEEVGRAKGQDLRYAFVIHENTDHHHAHVIVLGRDEDNRKVRFDRMDHMRMRAFGDRYLEREHGIELKLDRDMEQFCRERGLNFMYEKEVSKDFYDQLYRQEKRAGRDKTDDILEWERFNSDWTKFIEMNEGKEPRAYLGQSSYHHIGRQSDLKGLIDTRHEIDQWKEIADTDESQRELAEEKIGELEQRHSEFAAEAEYRTKPVDGWIVMDDLADEMKRDQRAVDKMLRPLTREEQERDRKAGIGLDLLIGIERDDTDVNERNPLLSEDHEQEKERSPLDDLLTFDAPREHEFSEPTPAELHQAEDSAQAREIAESVSLYSETVGELHTPRRGNDDDLTGMP